MVAIFDAQSVGSAVAEKETMLSLLFQLRMPAGLYPQWHPNHRRSAGRSRIDVVVSPSGKPTALRLSILWRMAPRAFGERESSGYRFPGIGKRKVIRNMDDLLMPYGYASLSRRFLPPFVSNKSFPTSRFRASHAADSGTRATSRLAPIARQRTRIGKSDR